ncbi:MBOAT family O-acyltransferase [Hanstruepera ponticola]|uniref:MBOAT family O-acyltransferase n=1 Tax=Hanstruepera ponticola TaxID=2042995 RepID=UPI001785AD7B|nr:MBOAT family protein [Hanstruepera ponticola]
MLFNSIDFAIFMPIVFLLYWFVFNKNLRIQNLFLIAVSYFFYACWDWRFLSLILISSVVDFLVGKKLSNETKKQNRTYLLLTSLFVNLGVLGFFKYYNFFINSFQEVFMFFGSEFHVSTLKIILPVGISFYTFQTLSYTIDVYKNRISVTKNPVSFFAFVSFFPQLVAGPIERASNLLPQFEKTRIMNYANGVNGLRLILLGLFKKMVIADNCAKVVNELFEYYPEHSGSTLLFGAFFFAFQIYGDFSGYTDIAIGCSKLLGFDLMQNFKMPYLSRNLGEFWRRWHISLSTWFRDYVYIPLGGSRVSKTRIIRNILVVFLLSGLWHGANWTFIIWGLIHALCFLPLILFDKNKKFNNIPDENRILPSFKTCSQILITFLIVVFAWIFFRAETLFHALQYLNGIFDETLFSMPQVSKELTLLLTAYMSIEWFQRKKEHVLDIDFINYRPIRIVIYYLVLFCIVYYSGNTQPFIYFQF